ncbi:MAG: MFS transporter [Chloroflexi bacterium]|nr:MFS transporter [Chloroflexota bacterium]
MDQWSRHPRYRLLVAVVVFLAFTLTIGIVQYSFGVFLTELERDFGWTRTEVSSAMSFFAVAGLFALPVGWALDRWGARPVMAISVAALAVSQLLRPAMTELWQFYALSALQFAAMPGAVMITGARLVGAWFDTNRGRAMGFTSMGANFGGILFSSLTAVLVNSVGWQAAYVVYGLLFAALLPLVLLIVREAPAVERRTEADTSTLEAAPPATAVSPTSLGVSLREAVRSRSFALVVFALFFAQVTYQSVLPQIVPHLEHVGITKTTAAASLSVLAFFGMGGKVFFGWFCERYPARYALIFSLSCQVTGLVWMLFVTGPAVWLFVPVFGLGFGALGVILPLLVQDTFGLRSFGTIFGLINFLTLGSALVGPPLVGASFDSTGSYQTAFLGISGLFALAAVSIWFARPLPGVRSPATTAV